MESWVRSAAVALLVGLVAPPVGAGEAWCLEFEEGQAAAKARGKDLLIDFGGSDWCMPCKWLKERVLSKSEFIELASRKFVLVDIDLLYRTPMPAERKNRYEELQTRYGIATVPTIVLALADGRPYVRTTYREAFATPKAYWDYLAPLRERGERLRAALARAATSTGKTRATELASALSEVDPRFVSRFYADLVRELRTIDPSDSTGYLAFLDGRRALDDFQASFDLHTAAIDPAGVDALIARAKLQGESLQEALILRAAGEVLAGQDRRALVTFRAVLDAQASRTRYDRGDHVGLDAGSIETVRRRIAEGEADPGSGVALEYALHRIFEFDMPNPYDWSCGAGFQPRIRVRDTIGDRYIRALLRSTEAQKGEARARALAKGLQGTFLAGKPVREVIDTITNLVGTPAAKALLPGEFYPRLLDR
jgi:thiol-disulfide isomerase/thioredoxin